MIFYFFLAVTNGLMVVMTRTVNASLGTFLGVFRGSFLNHLIGSFFAGLLLLLGLGTGKIFFSNIPFWYFTGGMIGIFLVFFSNYAVPRLGATAVGIIMIFSQLSTSSFIDHFALLEATLRSLTLLKISGLALILFGTVLVVRKRKEICL